MKLLFLFFGLIFLVDIGDIYSGLHGQSWQCKDSLIFFSCFSSLRAEGVEAMEISWKGERVLIFLLFAAVGRAVACTRRSRVEGVMVVPF